MALSESVDFDLVADSFNELGSAFPGVQFYCFRTVADDIIEQLKSGDTEVALAGPIDDSWARLESWPLFTEVLIAAGVTSNSLAALTKLSCHTAA